MSEFKTDLCDCCAIGCGQCMYSWFCTPCSNASARSEFDGSNWCFNCLCVGGPVAYNIIREGYGVEGDCCTDILVSCFCAPCASTRLNAEVQARGPRNKSMV
eukprot:TRINITY_DN344_c0_g1_i1.p1 TRINITY_DN344_c0_g1~~TRINITY_DN344_c0_g1_i1.p1  ORF type:complete len:102 (+),score=6.23 TRINITY_DN344_c0_g1_i1:55-360(+)